MAQSYTASDIEVLSGLDPVRRRRVTVALTAYNDEDSIVSAVQDFIEHPLVERVTRNALDRLSR